MEARKADSPIQSWPADAVERVAIDKLIPYARNARTHSDAQVAQIAASIREWGWTIPVLVDESGTVIAGHGRLLAAQQLGLTDVPTMVAKGWSDAKRRAYTIADNRLALNSGWDETMLALELSSLSEDDFDLDILGFDVDEIVDLLDGPPEGQTDPDAVPDTLPESVSKPGDVWLLGKHRLMCGDSTDAGMVARLMGGEKAVLVITDPPYGVSYADKNKFLNAANKGNSIQTQIENDHMDKEKTQSLWKSAFAEMDAVMSPGAVVYCFMPQGGDQMMMMMMMMMGAGIEPRHELIWLKNNHVLGRTDYAYKHEPILYAWKDGGHKFYGGFQTSILEFPRPQKSDLHPTMKPVALVAHLIVNSSKRDTMLYEPFSGSGTTLIAAEQTNRRCYAMELSPNYVDVAVRRWQQFTGKVATHADTDEPFPG